MEFFGSWKYEIDKLREEWNSSKPFNHIVIDNFLEENTAEKVFNIFPSNFKEWDFYCNPIEVKYACNKIENFHPIIKKIFDALGEKKIIDKIIELTGIQNLEKDDFLHGSGLHSHTKDGRLMLHLDYEKHPIYENKQRRINIILYLSKNWKDEWEGATELWNKDLSRCEKSVHVKFNRALVFKTNEESWHGLPKKIKCPENVFRNSLAYYYISPLESLEDKKKVGAGEDGYRKKATFSFTRDEEKDERIKKFLDIRPYRRITSTDIENIWKDWNPENY
tara:strand:- start:930 stop:1763 length:834 start_codon:yes stop_codon:yes gene_type:complete